MTEQKHIIYKITNLLNNKIYVGAHSTYDENDSYFGSGTALRNAIKKYGINNFQKDILFIYDDRKTAFLKEREIVNETFVNDKNTYNLTLGGRGIQHSETTKNAISQANTGKLRGRKLSEEHKRKIKHGLSLMPKRDRFLTAEQKLNLSIKATGRKLSEETKLKISKATSGENNGMFGRRHSDISKKNMSINKIGKYNGDKNPMHLKGGHTEKSKEKISKAAQNRPILTCPHCNKSGKANAMKQWHFNNCKWKNNENNV